MINQIGFKYGQRLRDRTVLICLSNVASGVEAQDVVAYGVETSEELRPPLLAILEPHDFLACGAVSP